ncbi:MAG: DUF2911 domain-containing protein [Chitinophagia bacterium]|nr:DUF2911 domain-containing protein [Chitinophagia bacterium]
MKRLLLVVVLIATAFGGWAQGGLKLPALSPNAKISQDFSVSSIDISYSRPSMRGRKIFGDVVAYGQVWRTGANAATRIKFGEDVELNGNKVKAGEYALYTIPGKDKWEIIINTGVGNWGVDGYTRDNDILRFTVKPMVMDKDVQTFTINITDISYSTCKIELAWERTRIVLPVKAVSDETIEQNIDKAVNHPSIPYFQVANYYNEKNIKLTQAITYLDRALAENPKAYYMWNLKARIERKLGHYDLAVEAARKSIDAAKGTDAEMEYTTSANKIIDEIKKGGNLATDKPSY